MTTPIKLVAVVLCLVSATVGSYVAGRMSAESKPIVILPHIGTMGRIALLLCTISVGVCAYVVGRLISETTIANLQLELLRARVASRTKPLINVSGKKMQHRAECDICCDGTSNAKLYPCRHTLCVNCAVQNWQQWGPRCPFCRTNIESIKWYTGR